MNTAQVVLTGYDRSKIDASLKILKKYLKTINVHVVDDSKVINANSKLWGTENDTEQEILFLNGVMDDLKKVPHVGTRDGVYLQLLLK